LIDHFLLALGNLCTELLVEVSEPDRISIDFARILLVFLDETFRISLVLERGFMERLQRIVEFFLFGLLVMLLLLLIPPSALFLTVIWAWLLLDLAMRLRL
jgi:hypothetical protein